MAMTLQEYEDRIAKSEDKLAKIEKRIQKWEDAKSDKNFAKHYDWLQSDNGWQIGWDNNKYVYGTFDEFKARRYTDWEKDCNDEIRRATREKEDTINTINKYKNAVSLLQDKESKPVIQIFKDFFNRWKAAIIEYVGPKVAEYYELNSKLVDMSNNRNRFQELGFETKEAFNAEYKRLRELERSLKSESFVGTAIDKGYRWNKDDFNKYLDDYMNERYFDLVDKVTNIVGEINDVSRLNIGYDGSLNGIISGDKGKAKIDTIIAGGYHENEIVNVKHGQIRHYRVLVHPLQN